MKRLLLFLVLFSSSLLILWAFVQEEGDDEVVVPPPQTNDEDTARPETGGPDSTPDAATDPAVEESGESSEASLPIDLDPPSGAGADGGQNRTERPGPGRRNREDEGFEATGLERTVKDDWQNPDGTTQQVLGYTVRMGHVKQEMGTRRFLAEDVSFIFYDRTPSEAIVARGTSDNAVFFTEGEMKDTFQDIEFRRDCILKDNVKVKLLGADGTDTDVFADILLLEEDRISSPAAGGYAGRVRIETDTMTIAGTEMEIDLNKTVLSFKKDIRIEGTAFAMPDLVALAQGASKKREPGGEPVVITCGGPFRFVGDRVGDDAIDQQNGSLLGTGTLSFEGDVVASRGDRDLRAEAMTMRFDRGEDGQLRMGSLMASSLPDDRMRMDAEFGQLLCRTLVWTAGTDTGGAGARMTGDPVIENIRFGSFPGQPASAETLLYRMSAREGISLDVIEGEDDAKNGLLVTLVGGGRIEPMSHIDPTQSLAEQEKAFFLEGEEVEFLLVAEPKPDGAAKGGDTAADEEPGYIPSEVRIKGKARVQMEGVLEADEIIMALGAVDRGSRLTVTMTRNARLTHEAFRLESSAILIRVFSDGLTDISTDSGFDMRVSLDAFSGTQRDGTQPAGNQISAEGDRSLRLWWPGETAGAAAEEESEKRALKIEGDYTIRVDRPGEETIVIAGKERFDMGTGEHEGAQLTTLRLSGSPHVAMFRDGVEEMSLDCEEATVDLDHNAPETRAESSSSAPRDDFAPVLSHRTKPGFFTKSLVRKIVALREVRLCYGSNIILCDSIDWDLPADLLVADGAGQPVRILHSGVRFSGDRIEIWPERETISVKYPKVVREGNGP